MPKKLSLSSLYRTPGSRPLTCCAQHEHLAAKRGTEPQGRKKNSPTTTIIDDEGDSIFNLFAGMWTDDMLCALLRYGDYSFRQGERVGADAIKAQLRKLIGAAKDIDE